MSSWLACHSRPMYARTATSTLESSRSDPERSLGLETACVCVLFGGRSSEREVSLTSGRQILKALDAPEEARDRRGPARVRAVEILPDGRWKSGPKILTPAAALEALGDVDVFFSALHGGEGENGTLQGLLAASDRAFTGTGVAGSAICMDKVFARRQVEDAGLETAPGAVVSRARWDRERAALIQEIGAWPGPGWVVKPREGGSSVGCSVVRKEAELGDAFDRALAWEREALVEVLVEGIEVTGAVLELPDAGRMSLPIVEIRPRRGHFFDYEEKYSESGAIELCPPEAVSERDCERLRKASLVAHEVLRCEGYSRTDFILPKDGSAPVFLETNTLPGMTPRSLLPRAAAEAGIDYRTLCLLIAARGLRRVRA